MTWKQYFHQWYNNLRNYSEWEKVNVKTISKDAFLAGWAAREKYYDDYYKEQVAKYNLDLEERLGKLKR